MSNERELEAHRKDWEELAGLDPLWAILSDPSRRFGRWNLAEFFASGDEEIALALSIAGEHGLPRRRDVAVDVGCGVGRLTRALGTRFTTVVGVDISEGMVAQARQLNEASSNCRFELEADPELRSFPNASADLVYSTLVLQHLPQQKMIERYIRSFLRILSAGGLAIFQLPTGMPLRKRAQPRRRLYALLRRLGVSDTFLYRRLRLTPIRMSWLPPERVEEVVREAGGEVIRAVEDERAGVGVPSRTYFISKRRAVSSRGEPI